MITELITHLRSVGSPVSDIAMTDIREDDRLPFSNTAQRVLLIREQSGPADGDISRINYDLFLASEGNATPQHRGAIMNTARQLQNWLVLNYRFGRVYGVDIPTGVNGPYKDGQNRYIAALSIILRRNTDA